MTILPAEATPLLLALVPAFSQPTFSRFTALLAAALLTTERRTIANLVPTLGPLSQGHQTSYQRVFSAASWSARHLACLLARFVIAQLLSDGHCVTTWVWRRRGAGARPRCRG